MPWFEILKVHEKSQHAIWFHTDPRVTISKKWRPQLVINITNEEAQLSIDQLIQKYKLVIDKHFQDGLFKVAQDKKKRSHLLEALVGMIKTSHQKGERDNARRVYKMIAGEDYTGEEYKDP